MVRRKDLGTLSALILSQALSLCVLVVGSWTPDGVTVVEGEAAIAGLTSVSMFRRRNVSMVFIDVNTTDLP